MLTQICPGKGEPPRHVEVKVRGIFIPLQETGLRSMMIDSSSENSLQQKSRSCILLQEDCVSETAGSMNER